MIVARGLTKRYGTAVAVDGIDMSVEPGRVTGFLGPNGAGKSTTMRMALGLDRPSAGSITVGGRSYVDLPAPLREVGALLDAGAVHKGRSARDHLLVLALSNAIPARRVEEVLDLVGLSDVAGRRAGEFSLGMSQRLGIAGALLGDPGVLLFDEPVNGLDPEGILWIRTLMRSLAEQGRTVLVSSHLMSEMALTADHLVVIGRGRVLADTSVRDFLDANAASWVRVRAPRPAELAEALRAGGYLVDALADGALAVRGATAVEVGERAGAAGLVLHELTSVQASLEEAFMQLTADSVQYSAGLPDRPLASTGA